MTEQSTAEQFAQAIEELFDALDARQSLDNQPDGGPTWADDLMQQIATDTKENQ